jgi:hypothetical protein
LDASHLRVGVETVATLLTVGRPPGEVAVLKALRHSVADLQQLLADYRGERAADAIRLLDLWL